jgi:hypothetical protein
MTIINLPASLVPIVQDGILFRVFQDALIANLVYRQCFTPVTIATGLGEKFTSTKNGLLALATTPISPAAASDLNSGLTPKNRTVEQYTLALNQYGDTADTNLLSNKITLASNFLATVKTQGIQAGMSLDSLARQSLFDAYMGGNSRASSAVASADDEIPVDDVRGFLTKLVNGVPTPVSPSNALAITIGSTNNTVVGVTYDPADRNAYGQIPGTLTVGTNATCAAGDAVVAANRPKIIRVGGGATINAVTGSNLVTLQNFIDATAYLHSLGVPPFPDGYYHVPCNYQTIAQLFQDSAFRQAYQSAYDSTEYKEGMVFTLAGCKFLPTQVAQSFVNGSVTVQMPVVCGDEAGLEGRFAGMSDFLNELKGPQKNGLVEYDEEKAVAFITRPPLDRLQQWVSTTWAAVLDWTVATDSGSNGIIGNSSAYYKRAVIIQHGS